MRQLTIDNYIITTPILDILYRLRTTIRTGKLREIKPGSQNIVVTCPNNDHDGGKEAHPACNIYIGSDPNIPYGYFRCFVCGDQGDFVKFVAECFNASEKFARSWLIENYGVKAFDKVTLGEDIVIGNPRRTKQLDETVLETFQHWTPYLGSRGLTRETCERFKVRYDPVTRQIIFPCYNAAGQLTMLARRSVVSKMFYMDADIPKPVYCLDTVVRENAKHVVITEGLIDCLLGNQYGMPTVATLGTPSDDQIAQLNRSCISVAYLMFDNDDAGEKFTRVLKAKLSKRILIKEVKIPNGKKDIGELSKEEFLSAIKNCK